MFIFVSLEKVLLLTLRQQSDKKCHTHLSHVPTVWMGWDSVRWSGRPFVAIYWLVGSRPRRLDPWPRSTTLLIHNRPTTLLYPSYFCHLDTLFFHLTFHRPGLQVPVPVSPHLLGSRHLVGPRLGLLILGLTTLQSSPTKDPSLKVFESCKGRRRRGVVPVWKERKFPRRQIWTLPVKGGRQINATLLMSLVNPRSLLLRHFSR